MYLRWLPVFLTICRGDGINKVYWNDVEVGIAHTSYINYSQCGMLKGGKQVEKRTRLGIFST
jgi:hypothetical protein